MRSSPNSGGAALPTVALVARDALDGESKIEAGVTARVDL
jgi:hypothetical protein